GDWRYSLVDKPRSTSKRPLAWRSSPTRDQHGWGVAAAIIALLPIIEAVASRVPAAPRSRKTSPLRAVEQQDTPGPQYQIPSPDDEQPALEVVQRIIVVGEHDLDPARL